MLWVEEQAATGNAGRDKPPELGRTTIKVVVLSRCSPRLARNGKCGKEEVT